MKRIVFVLLFVFCLVSVSLALSDKYQIFSEKKGLFGLGGRTILLLDRESGDTWRYSGEKWVAIPKVSEEAAVRAIADETVPTQPPEIDKKAKMEAEVNVLKAKQEADLKALQAKQAEEIKGLIDSMNSPEPVKIISHQEKKAEMARPIRAARLKAEPSAAKTTKSQDDEDNGPPAWLGD